MGKTLFFVILGLFVCSLYILHAVYQSVIFLDVKEEEAKALNRLSAGDAFDAHLFVSFQHVINWGHATLYNKPNWNGRYVPLLAADPSGIDKECCMDLYDQKEENALCYVLSFRSTYGFTPSAKKRSFFNRVIRSNTTADKTPYYVTECSSLKTAFQNASLVNIYNESSEPPPLSFSLPSFFERRRSKKRDVYLHVVGTRPARGMLSQASRDKEARRGLAGVLAFRPIAKKLTENLVPEPLKHPTRLLLQDLSGRYQQQQLALAAQRMAPYRDINIKDSDSVKSLLTKAFFLSVPKKITLGPVIEHRALSLEDLNNKGLSFFVSRTAKNLVEYWPPFQLHSLNSPRDEFCVLDVEARDLLAVASGGRDPEKNAYSLQHCNISLQYAPSGFPQWILEQQLTEVLNDIETRYKIPAYDIDSFKLMIGGQHPILIGTTFLVSFLHLLFSFLAVSSDFVYWKHQSERATLGIPVYTILGDILSSLLISLYLFDEGKSRFVVLMSVIRCPLDLWKLSKIAQAYRSQQKKRSLDNGSPLSDTLKDVSAVSPDATSTGDALSLKQLEAYERRQLLTLTPAVCSVILGAAVYQLVYVPQKSWRSWLMHSAALCAYGAGFLAMTPQLFRNYKLKSVAHLPWAVLTYQALNAIVDDFFSFIIRMPMTHRYA